MNKIFLSLIMGLSLFGFDYNLKPVNVTDGVWCFFGKLEPPTNTNGGNMVNSCYIKTKDSFVVFDSGPTYDYAKQSYEVMKQIASLPVKAVILGHEHDDHWLGNSFYKDKFDATLYGVKAINDTYKKFSQTRMSNILSKDITKETKVVPIDKIISKTTTLKIGGLELELNYLSYKAHTKHDIFLYIKENKIIFASDLVMNGRITSNRDGSLFGQIKAIKAIEKKDYDILIAGHGKIYDKNAINESKRYFHLLNKRIPKAIGNGVDAADINKVVKLKEYKDKALYDDLNAKNISQAYTEIEFQ
ncbi:MAG: MBL fold metallo-hydrolase [Epsilonproteobacteria bacterium]|nr:MAG: MBL fold metallo-hydrolase [Campylobacterota bacterium]